LRAKETKANKSTRGMPRLSEAMKDVVSCDKLRGVAHTHYIRRFPNGTTHQFIGTPQGERTS
jgi:hypothetical protein